MRTNLIIFIATLLLISCGAARAQTTRSGYVDDRTFLLTPVPPPQPAMKNQLLFENLSDRRPGNAATLYFDAILLMKPDTPDRAQQALDAYDQKDFKTFDKLADELALPDVFQELDLAARREDCNWDPPYREIGVRTLLPHLRPVRDLAQLIKVRALHQLEQGKSLDAFRTLRLGYELAIKVGREPALVSALVSLGMVDTTNDALADLMNRPDSPNLYWALENFPRRKSILRIDDGRFGVTTGTIPELTRVLAGEELSAGQWRRVLNQVHQLAEVEWRGKKKLPEPIADTSPQVLKDARQWYAKAHHLDEKKACETDPAMALGSYYFSQFQIAYDDMYKLLGLPYPELLEKSDQYGKQVEAWQRAEPSNPFYHLLPGINHAVETFTRVDAQLAALTAVEALRAYAAAHEGSLPKRLEDVTDTPVPENPATGKPFHYELQDGTAVISDRWANSALRYSLRIRK